MISKAATHPAPHVTAEIDRPIINADGSSVRHLVVTVRAPELESKPEMQRLPLNLGLVIDASGSMSGSRLESAKMAAAAVIDALADDDHMSLVSFADDAVQHATAVRLAASGRGQLTRAVHTIVTRGSTDLAGGWLSGCEAVAGRQATCETTERNHVVLLSDGHANQGQTNPSALAEHATELRRRGILTSTVGVGSNYSPTQLQAIAEAGGGRMHDAERPDEIARIVIAELNDTLATTVEHLEISLRLPKGVKAELYGVAPCAPTRGGLDVVVGSILGGATRRLVIKLRLPAGELGDTLAVRVKARWQVPGDHTPFSCTVDDAVMRFDTAKACLAQPRNDDLARIIAEQWQSNVYHRAMVLNQDGQGHVASDFVRRELKYLVRYCEGMPEMQDLAHGLEQFSDSVRHRYSAVTSKEVMLRAYKSSRGETDRRGRTDVDFVTMVEQEVTMRSQSPDDHQP